MNYLAKRLIIMLDKGMDEKYLVRAEDGTQNQKKTQRNSHGTARAKLEQRKDQIRPSSSGLQPEV